MTATKGSALETIPLIIDGKATSANPSVKFPVFGLEVQRDVFLAESADVDVANRAADASWKTFLTWKKTPGVTRRRLLTRYAELLRKHEDDFVQFQRLEVSMDEVWARKNVHLAADLIEEIAAGVTRLEGQIPQTQTTDSVALAFTVPVGPVLSISPSVVSQAPSLEEELFD